MITAIFLSVLVALFIVVLAALIIMALSGELTDVYDSSLTKNEKPYWEDLSRTKK